MKGLVLLSITMNAVAWLPSGALADWYEDFDSYESGSSMHGQGGWKGWDNSPFYTAYVTDAQARSSPHSVDIVGAADLVHEFSGCSSGHWTFTAWQYIPGDFVDQSYFCLLNTYSDFGPYNYSCCVRLDGPLGIVQSEFDGAWLPLITDQWVELRIEIDLDADVQNFFYNSEQLFEKSWTEGFSGDGALNIAAVDLYANSATSIFYDDLSLISEASQGACCFPEGYCEETGDEWQCYDWGGTEWFPGVDCDPNPCNPDTVFYVDDDAPPGGDGSSWANAFDDLRDATDIGLPGDEIRVAAGTYKPDRGTGDRLATFQLQNGVAIYGGYAGLSNPEDPDVRDLELYPSVLNGDLLEDDDLGGDCAAEWSDCCFSHPGPGCDDADCESTICYEWTLECMEWDPESGDCIWWEEIPPVGEWCCEGEDWGSDCAALAREYCEVCSGVSTSTGPDCDNSCHVVTGSGADATAILDGFVITAGNADAFDANAGGGLYNDGGNPTITDCVFTGNSAEFGGGMGNDGASPTLTNCMFTENTASDDGGAVRNTSYSNPILVDCLISGNSAGDRGGGMQNRWHCAPTLINCTFSGNAAGWGAAGMFNDEYEAPVLVNCTFINNLGTGSYYDDSTNGTLTDCAFIGNSGYGVYCYTGSSPTLTNCVFIGNSDRGMSCYWYNTNPTLINCTFSGNSGSPGGAIYCGDYSGPTLTNCVLWNGVDGVWCAADATPTITYSDVQGGWEGTGNINADPLFVPGPLGPYYLSQTAAGDPLQSPCVDAGDATSPLVDGTTRSDEVLDTGIVDMGYHYPVSGLPLIMGDFDYDGDLDLGDFAGFADCLGGSDQTILSPPCRVFDFDADGDVDLGDFASFQVAFAGA